MSSSLECLVSEVSTLQSYSVVWNGPLLLGYLFSYGLLGVLVVQVFVYHTRFPNDKGWLKALIWSLLFLECLASALATNAAWNGVATICPCLSWSITAWPFKVLPGLASFIASLTHTFFSWRIWMLGKSKILPFIIVMLSALQFILGAYAGATEPIGRSADTPASGEPVGSLIVMPIWLGGSFICDALITVKIVMLLRNEQKMSRLKKTDTVLSKLIEFTVETGMVAAVAALLQLMCWVSTTTNLDLLWFLMLSKLYANTVIATLNTRLVIPLPAHQFLGSANAALWDEDAAPPSQSLRFAHNVKDRRRHRTVHVTATSEMLCSSTNDVELGDHQGGPTEQDISEWKPESFQGIDSIPTTASSFNSPVMDLDIVAIRRSM